MVFTIALNSFFIWMESKTGSTIKLLLKRKRLTQVALADLVGVSVSAVNQWVSGRARIDQDHLPKVAGALGISVDDLLAGRIDGTEVSQALVHEPTIALPYLASKTAARFEGCVPATQQTWPVQERWVGSAQANYMVIEIEGHAMEQELRAGSTVLAERVTTDELPYIEGGIYAVKYAGRLVVRRIRTNDLRSGKLTLHADNESYGSTVVPANELECVWRVLTILYQPVR